MDFKILNQSIEALSLYNRTEKNSSVLCEFDARLTDFHSVFSVYHTKIQNKLEKLRLEVLFCFVFFF